MNSALNEQFTNAVESLVACGGQKCAKCGLPVAILDGLIKCEGPCGISASINLNIPEPIIDPRLEGMLRQCAQNMAKIHHEAMQTAFAAYSNAFQTSPDRLG